MSSCERSEQPGETPASSRRQRTEERGEAPLELAIPDSRSAELGDLLREMDDCESRLEYAELSRRVVTIAERSSIEGCLDDSYRVIVELARHAAEEGKRPAGQAQPCPCPTCSWST